MKEEELPLNCRLLCFTCL